MRHLIVFLLLVSPCNLIGCGDNLEPPAPDATACACPAGTWLLVRADGTLACSHDDRDIVVTPCGAL